jgi:transcriptional regulator with XRE-family HTH domain
MNCGEQIKNRIRELCAARGFSVNRLAEMSGLRQSTLDSLLREDSPNPKINTLLRISNGFGMSLPEFLNTDGIRNASVEDDGDVFDVRRGE